MPEWFLFLPQVQFGIDDVVARAHTAEDAGFDGVALIDHLEAPGAPRKDIWEALTLATWVAARTERLKIGHLVLCDAFRHPAVLAKAAVTLAAASGGRFELGLGTGSYLPEFERFGFDTGQRVTRLAADLEAIRRYWGADRDDAQQDGEQRDGAQHPLPPSPIPLVLGGTGPRMLELVRQHADWWNVPVHRSGDLERLRGQAGRARVSVQSMVGLVHGGADAGEVRATAVRRFGDLEGLACGPAEDVARHFRALAAQGVERFYVWFSDFAPPSTIEAFAEGVIGKVRKG